MDAQAALFELPPVRPAACEVLGEHHPIKVETQPTPDTHWWCSGCGHDVPAPASKLPY